MSISLLSDFCNYSSSKLNIPKKLNYWIENKIYVGIIVFLGVFHYE